MRSVYGTRFRSLLSSPSRAPDALDRVVIPEERWVPLDGSDASAADALREVGRDRVVYGTDRDAIPLALHLDEIHEALPTTDEEIRDLLDVPAPYLEPRDVKR